MAEKEQTAVIVGGGVAGTSCAIHLNALSPTTRISLIDPQPSLKLCHALTHLSHTTLDTAITEAQAQEWCNARNITFHRARATALASNMVTLDNSEQLPFHACCIASGARPFLPDALRDARFACYVLTLRDTDSVQMLMHRLGAARRVVVVGAGGIGMEIVHEIEHCDVVWVIKGAHIGGSFFDDRIAKCVDSLPLSHSENGKPDSPRGHEDTFVEDAKSGALNGTNPVELPVAAAAVGPNWLGQRDRPILLDPNGTPIESKHHFRSQRLQGAQPAASAETITSCEVKHLHEDGTGEWKVMVELSNGRTIGCDAIIAGTGVVANTEWLGHSGLNMDGEENGANVDAGGMATNMTGVFAAGDCAHVVEDAEADWVQLRTWGQAFAGGRAAAAAMAQHLGVTDVGFGLEFEVFAHSTRFFGRRVVLLGRWKAQGLNEGFEMLERQGDKHFVRVVLQNGLVRGAVLIGDVDNAEVFENLIVGRINVGWMGDSLVDENVDLENYFD